MKRNLLSGIILVSAVALSSCTTLNEVAKNGALGDDVYYTKAKAAQAYNPAPYVVPQPEPTFARNDDYYYYGDYASLISRFSYASPFNYDDDYDYSYTPYTSYQDTSKTVYADADYSDDNYYDDLGVYSAYDFGYGDFDGYDDFGYGLAYSGFVSSGGTRTAHKRWYSHANNKDGGPVFVRVNGRANHYGSQLFNRTNNGTVATASPGSGFVRGGTNGVSRNSPGFSGPRPGGSSAVYPGRPGTNSASTNALNIAGTNRPVRPDNQAPRQYATQRSDDQSSSNSNSNSAPQRSAPASVSSGGSSGGGGSSSGGGGRPVRP